MTQENLRLTADLNRKNVVLSRAPSLANVKRLMIDGRTGTISVGDAILPAGGGHLTPVSKRPMSLFVPPDYSEGSFSGGVFHDRPVAKPKANVDPLQDTPSSALPLPSSAGQQQIPNGNVVSDVVKNNNNNTIRPATENSTTASITTTISTSLPSAAEIQPPQGTNQTLNNNVGTKIVSKSQIDRTPRSASAPTTPVAAPLSASSNTSHSTLDSPTSLTPTTQPTDATKTASEVHISSTPPEPSPSLQAEVPLESPRSSQSAGRAKQRPSRPAPTRPASPSSPPVLRTSTHNNNNTSTNQ